MKTKNLYSFGISFIAYTILILTIILNITQAIASNLTLTTGGRVTIELITSSADFSNTLSVVSPNVGVAITGCQLEPAVGLTGQHILSEKRSQHGCRVDLDADPATNGIQGFNAGTVLEFRMCAQTDSDADCEFVWSSSPNQNSDSFDHLRTTPIRPADFPSRIFQLAWEDLENGGDQDFNDLIAVVRVETDTDSDGLWDDWEQFGIDADGDGSIDLNLPALGANPRHRDIFVEIDFMDCVIAGGDCPAGDTHSHRPKNDAVNTVVQAFANAPIQNPDGNNGINLHIDIDNAISHQNVLNIGCIKGAGVGFDTLKNNHFGQNNPRRFSYHYIIFSHQQSVGNTASGCSEISGNDLLISLGGWNVGQGDVDGDGDDDENVGSDQQQAGTLLHELGHNLNLEHGGGECINYKPNYISNMNYRFQFGIPPNNRLDYSRIALANLREDNNNLNETLGIGDGTDDTRYVCPNNNVRGSAGTGPIDWNCDGDNGIDPGVTVNINGDCIDIDNNPVTANCGDCDAGENPRLDQLNGFNDWESLKYDFQNSGNFEDGRHVRLDVPDMDFPTYKKIINKLPVANAGTDQELECTGPDGVSTTLNGSGSYDPDSDPLTFIWTGPFGTLSGVTIQPTIPLGTHDINLEVTDSKGGAANDTVIVMVRDTTPPTLGVTLSPNSLWPPNHKMVTVTADVQVSDTCDPKPLVTLVSITSNEPDNGLGDGDTQNDIQNAAFETDDRSFTLRAERSGTGTGRIYMATFRVTDHTGNTSTSTAQVVVPHN